MSVSENQKRRRLICLCLLVIIIGVLSRVLPLGSIFLNKYLGDALYAILFYLIVSIIAINAHPVTKGMTAFAVMAMLEIFQLTGIPLVLSQNKNVLIRLIAILLGTTFSWLDILAYFIGIVSIIFFERVNLKNRPRYVVTR